MENWIDVSVLLHNQMVHWPGDPEFRLEQVKSLAKGDSVNLSQITLGSHSGTHIDAPRHFLKNGQFIHELLLDAVIGRARVLRIEDPEFIRPEELQQYKIRKGERLLFRTLNSPAVWQKNTFSEHFVSLSKSAADYLADREIKTIGIDYLSIGGYKGDGHYIHEKLLGLGICIIEGLDLSPVEAGKYYMVCLPLKVDQAEGAPARAILRPL